MRALELLIEDYERRLKTITESIEKNRSNGSIVHQRREERLNTKASEYRTFIAELNRAMAVEKSDSTCNLQSVSQQSEQLAIAALDKIAHPIKYLQSEAEKDGCKLDGYMAIQLTQDANFYQEIADKALKAIANCG